MVVGGETLWIALQKRTIGHVLQKTENLCIVYSKEYRLMLKGFTDTVITLQNGLAVRNLSPFSNHVFFYQGTISH